MLKRAKTRSIIHLINLILNSIFTINNQQKTVEWTNKLKWVYNQVKESIILISECIKKYIFAKTIKFQFRYGDREYKGGYGKEQGMRTQSKNETGEKKREKKK